MVASAHKEELALEAACSSSLKPDTGRFGRFGAVLGNPNLGVR